MASPLIVNSSAGDGMCYQSATAWASAHDAANADVTEATGTSSFTEVTRTGSEREIRRQFFPFDTSGLPDDCTITSATLRVTAVADCAGGEAALVQSTQASASTLVDADYSRCNTTELAARITGAWNTGDHTFTLNEAGLAWINKTGTTFFCLRDGAYDVDNVDPADAVSTRFRACFLERAESAYRPLLTVNYTEAPSGNPHYSYAQQ